MFGPLFYTTLLVAIPLGLYAAFARFEPLVSEWREVQSLVELLRSTDLEVRERSADLLGQRGSAIALPIFLDAAHDPRGDVRALACQSLVETWSDPLAVIPVLIAATHDQEDEVREVAARGLARVANSGSRSTGSSRTLSALAAKQRADSLHALRQLLKDRSSTIRAAAAGSLAAFGQVPDSAAALTAAARDPDRAVRFAAARALVRIGDGDNPVATQTLLALLAEPDLVPDRRAVLEFLAGMGPGVHDRAVGTLETLLSHEDIAVVSDVVECLSADGPQARAVLPALNRLLQSDDSHLRASTGMAIVAIEGQESPRAVELLLRITSDPALELPIRENAVAMIRPVKPAALSKATPDLIRQLGSTNARVRESAVNLLLMIVGDTPAEMPILTKQP